MDNVELPKKPNELNPLTLAYIGDAVYEIYIRKYVIAKGGKPNKLHHQTITFVSANAQSNVIHGIMEHLTDEERDVVRRGRNAKSNTVPKNVDVINYKYSTAFEALIGYHYLLENKKRLEEIIEMAINYIERKAGDRNGKK